MLEAATLGSLIIKLVGDSQNYTAELDKALSSTDRTTKLMAGMFKASAAIIGAALVAISTASVVEFAKFDKAMTQSLSIMGKVSAETRKEMEATARQLAVNSVTSADKAAEAYYFLASAGLNAKQSMAALGVVEKFAVAGAFDMAKATTLLADSTSALGLASKDATVYMSNLTRVSDVISAAANMANASQEQFAEALTTKSAAALRALNKDVEEGMAVLAVFADQGIKAALAGEKLSIVLRDLQMSAERSKKQWEELGLSVYDSAGKMRPIAYIMEDLDKRMVGMSDAQVQATYTMLGFGAESLAAFKTLAGTSDKIRQYEANLRAAGGTTEEVYRKQMTSFVAQLSILQNRIKEVALAIGEQLVPVLMSLNAGLSDSYAKTNGYATAVESLASTIRNNLVGAIGVAADVFYGWRLILLTLDLAFTTLGGTVAWFCKSGEVLILSLSTVFEKSIKGWTGILDLTVYGLKLGFNKFLLWMRQMQISAAESLNNILPDSKKYSEEWFAPLRADVARLNDEIAGIKAPDLSMTTANGAALEKATAEWEKFANEQDDFSQRNKQTAEEIWRLAAEGAPSDRMKKALADTEARQQAEAAAERAASKTRDMEQAIADLLKEVYGETEKVTEATKNWAVEAAQLRADIAYTWEAALPQIEKYNQMLKDGAITQDEYNRAIDRLGIMPAIVDPIKEALVKVSALDALLKKNQITLEQYQEASRDALSGGSQFIAPIAGQAPAPGLNADTDRLIELQNQEALLTESYERQKAITDQFYADSIVAAAGNSAEIVRLEEQRFLVLGEMNQSYVTSSAALARQTLTAQLQATQFYLSTAANGFDQLLGMLEQSGQKGSAAYKALFLMAKAAAVAMAIVNTFLAYTMVMAAPELPWISKPAIAAITVAGGMAAVASIIGTTIAGFEGGGLIADGPRTGGMDGRGGKLAVLHPNERVIDLEKNDDPYAGNGGGVTVNVNNYGNDDVSVTPSQDGRVIDVVIKKVREQLSNDIVTGRGSVPAAMQRTYGLTRGK